MKPQHVVTLLGVAIAVVVIALALIAIIVELRKVYMQLIVILGAVAETGEKTEGLDSVTSSLAGDLAAGEAALAAGVERLEHRLSRDEGGSVATGPAGGSVRY